MNLLQNTKLDNIVAEITNILGNGSFDVELIDKPVPMYVREGEIDTSKTLVILNFNNQECVQTLKEFTEKTDEFYEIWRGGESLTFTI